MKKRVKKEPKESKPLTKIIVRRLPPKLVEEEFLEAVDPIAEHDYSNAGQKSAEGRFLSKLVYKFLPSQNLVHLSHHRGGGQLPKNTYETL